MCLARAKTYRRGPMRSRQSPPSHACGTRHATALSRTRPYELDRHGLIHVSAGAARRHCHEPDGRKTARRRQLVSRVSCSLHLPREGRHTRQRPRCALCCRLCIAPWGAARCDLMSCRAGCRGLIFTFESERHRLSLAALSNMHSCPIGKCSGLYARRPLDRTSRKGGSRTPRNDRKDGSRTYRNDRAQERD